MTQQARNVVAALEARDVVQRHLIRDRDARFSRSFDDVWRSIGAQIIRTPVRTPVTNAYAKRSVGAARRQCLDHLLIVDRSHLERVLKLYVGHYKRLALIAVSAWLRRITRWPTRRPIRCSSVFSVARLSAVIHEYELVAA